MSKKVELTDGGLQYFINSGFSQERIDEIRSDPDDQFTVRWANETANGRNLYNVTQAITDPKTGKTFLVEYASYSGESFKEAIAREVREGYTDFFICEIDSGQAWYEVSYYAPEGDVIREAVETNDDTDIDLLNTPIDG